MESPDEKDKSSKKVRKLYQYMNNNKEGLLPYQKRGIKMPEPREVIGYKDGRTGKPELHGNHAADETQTHTVVSKRTE